MPERGTATATILYSSSVPSSATNDATASRQARPLDHGQVAGIVLRHGGRIVGSGGEGVTAAFEAASQAVRAAASLLNIVARAAPEMTMSIGLAAGDVSWEDEDCFGTPVVTAARLQAAAGGGQILISHTVRLLAGERAGDRYEHVGPLELPGIADPVEAYLVGWETPDGDDLADGPGPPPMALALGASAPYPFVGRADAIAELNRSWREARTSSGRIVLLGGESGAGKTRLAFELARRLHDQGAAVLYGSCDNELALPYQPWVQALDQALPALPRAAIADLRPRLVPLARLLAHAEPAVTDDLVRSPTSPEADRYRLYDAFTAVLSEAAATWPTIVVLDDLHWAGAQTLALLSHLAHAGIPPGLLVVGTFRDTGDEITEPLAGCLADLRRVDGASRLRVGRLDAAAVDRFVAAATGQALDDDLRHLALDVTERTGGNAFYLGELWRHLVSSGVVARSEDGWVVHGSAASTHVPDSVREVVAARLARLSPPARRLVDVAALAGQRIDLQVLALAADLSGEQLEPPVEELVSGGLLTEVASSALVYRFEHALVRDTVEEAIAPLAKVRLHRDLARAIETVHEADRRPVLAELARHFAAAASLGTVDKAVYYGRRAATQAIRSAAYDEAIAHLDTVVGLVLDSVTRAEVLVELGATQLRRGYYLASLETCGRAFRLAVDHGAVDIAAQAALGYEAARHFPGLPGGPAVELLQEALDLVGEDASGVHTRLLASLGRALAHAGRTAEGVGTAERAVAQARAVGDPESLTIALQAILTSVDEPISSLAAAAELAGLAEQLGDPFSTSYAYCNEFRALIALGRFDEAAEALARFRELSNRWQFSAFIFMSHAFEVVFALAAGDFAAAERAAELASVPEPADQSPFKAGVYGMQMFTIRRAQGRLAEVAPILRHLATAPDPPPMWRPGLAALYAELGLLDDARAVFESLAPDGFAAVARDSIWPGCLAFLADTCLAIGDRQRAVTLYDELAVFRDRNLMVAFTVCLGPADRLLGGLAALLGDDDLAVTHHRAAIELAERSKSPVWTAEAQFDLATVLHARGDVVGAAALRSQALTTAHLLGMGRLVDRAEPPPPATPPAKAVAPVRPDGLSERELEVLTLVAEGLPNREIGRRLFISQNTVANHVRSILQKTGCANRTEAASYAVRGGVAGGMTI